MQCKKQNAKCKLPVPTGMEKEKPKGHMKASHLKTNRQYEPKKRMTIQYTQMYYSRESEWHHKQCDGKKLHRVVQ